MKTLRQIAEEYKDQIIEKDQYALATSQRGFYALLHEAQGSIVAHLSNPRCGVTLAGYEPDDWTFEGFLDSETSRGYDETIAFRQYEQWRKVVDSIRSRYATRRLIEEFKSVLEENKEDIDV